jgi:hypothetical protein
MIWHKGKLQLFERGPTRWAGGVALQPGLEAFLVVAWSGVSLGVFQTGLIYSRVVTFWCQGSHFVFLELHETNTAVFHRHSHQTELKLYPPIFELPAPLDLDRANEWDVGRVLRTIAWSCRTRSFALPDHLRNRERPLYNVLCRENGFVRLY